MRLAQRQIRRFLAGHSHHPGRVAERPDPEESRRVMKAMLQMKKIEVEALQRASADRA
jgi:hypothetical protein